MSLIQINPQDIKQGDQFVSDGRPVWTALSDARIEGTVMKEIAVDVMYDTDGGRSRRIWDYPTDVKLGIERKD